MTQQAATGSAADRWRLPTLLLAPYSSPQPRSKHISMLEHRHGFLHTEPAGASSQGIRSSSRSRKLSGDTKPCRHLDPVSSSYAQVQ